MCLAVPVRVETLLDDDQAIVELGGTRKQISLALVDDVAVGDYVILHVGFALNKIDPKEAQITLQLLRQMAEAEDTIAVTPEVGTHEVR